jgi:hypothetical protein
VIPVASEIWVPVVDVSSGREIGWSSNIAETLNKRHSEIQEAIATGTELVASSLSKLPSPDYWRVEEVEGTFGITLAAEAGVILSKASAEAALEVKVTFARKHDS